MELFLVIIGLDITILMHYMLKYVKLNSTQNERLVEEIQRSKFEIAQISEEIRKANPNYK